VSRRLLFAAAAQTDLQEILAYIARDSPERARTFVRALRQRCQRIPEQPRMGRLREEFGAGIRTVIHGDYLILYGERKGAIVVERIVHGARDLLDL